MVEPGEELPGLSFGCIRAMLFWGYITGCLHCLRRHYFIAHLATSTQGIFAFLEVCSSSRIMHREANFGILYCMVIGQADLI